MPVRHAIFDLWVEAWRKEVAGHDVIVTRYADDLVVGFAYTWPVPEKRVEKRADGITYYNKSRTVDQPMVATVSADGQWVIASFSSTTGNVWSNPELTCQHVDPQADLKPGGAATIEVKLLVLHGSLDEVLKKVQAQRGVLRAGQLAR